MLKMQNINMILGNGTKLARPIFKNLNLEVESGEFVVIIGGNGSGKSTLFNLISGFLSPDNGNILIGNENITNRSQKARSGLISKVMQDPRVGTIENMTIFENMAFSLMRGSSRGFAPFASYDRRAVFKNQLSVLGIGLEDRLDDLVVNLSGGQRQALSLVMAIIADSKVLLLDEITAALDPTSSENIMKLTNKIVRDQKRTCIMITHNMSHAIEYGDRILVLEDGEFVREFCAAQKTELTPNVLAAEFV